MCPQLDSGKLSCSCSYIRDTPTETRELWIRCEGELVAVGKIFKSGKYGTVTAYKPQYSQIALAYLKENFPEYNWK